MQALTGLQAGRLQSVECLSNEILLEYFGVYSLSSKAYRTQGGNDLLFREVARVLLEAPQRRGESVKNRGRFCVVEEMICVCVCVCE